MAEITISGRNITVTPALREAVETKMNEALSVFDTPATCEVVLRVEHNPSNPVPKVVEITVFAGKTVIRVREAGVDMYAAIDAGAERLARQMRKYKTRIIDRKHHAAGLDDVPIEVPEVPADEDEQPEEDLILREKLIEFTTLSEDQALFQTDLLGHDFFVFTNEATGDVNVIYRRKDGGYGILKPVVPPTQD